MCSSVLIFGQSIRLYDVLMNLGTVLGLGAMLFMLYKYGTREKRDFAAYAVSLALSYPFCRLLRGIIQADDLSELFTCGGHLYGMVFGFYFVFPAVYRLICKKLPTEEIKGFSAVYFTIQHLCSRLGCYSLGCCFGVYYTGPFAVTFPFGTNPYSFYGIEMPIFPTQLFEAFCSFCLLIMSVVMIYKHKRPYRPFVILFSMCIFISEIFMYKYAFERKIGSFSYIQLWCAVLLLIEAVRFIKGRLKSK